MNTMKSVVTELLENKKVASFEVLWNEVKEQLNEGWTEAYSATSDIEKVKIGELYTMLTTNGEFVKNENDEWSLTIFYSFEEVQKMRINAGDLED